MRLLKSVLVAAALAFAAPVWAHGGHGHHHGWDKHHDRGHWRHHGHHRHHGWHHRDRHYYYSRHYYYPPYPVYAAPAPGVHIVVPNIYIPLR